MATPCSVNARGGFRVPPQLDVPKWNFKFCSSSADNCTKTMLPHAIFRDYSTCHYFVKEIKGANAIEGGASFMRFMGSD
jgi:hypothetical protein